jgi:outer membrane protein assembly factor BamB
MDLVRTWRFKLERERRVGSRHPVISGSTVYVAFHYDKGRFFQSRLVAFDLQSGSEKWSYVIDHLGNEPVVGHGTIFWSSSEGSIHALNEDGALLWKAPEASGGLGNPVLGSAARIFVYDRGGAQATWALDCRTGATLWKFKHGGHGHPLCCADGRVYHSSVADTGSGEPARVRCSLYCLSEYDGSVQWSLTGTNWLFNPLVFGSHLYVCSHRTLWAHDALDGKLLAELELSDEAASSWLAPCSSAGRLYVWKDTSDEGRDGIVAVDVVAEKHRSGEERLRLDKVWTAEVVSICEGPSLFTSDQLVYLTHSGHLCALDTASGAASRLLDLKSKPSRFGGLCQGGEFLVATHGAEVVTFSPGSAEQSVPADVSASAGSSVPRSRRPNGGERRRKSPPAAQPTDFETLVAQSIEELRLKTQAHDAMWHLGEADWSVDQDQGQIVFRHDAITATAPVQIIGTFNREDSTWLWAWDHASVVPGLQEHATRVHEYGKQNGIKRFITRKLACTENEGWEFAAVACKLCGAEGAYRGPVGQAFVFMTFGEVTLTKSDGSPGDPT